MVRHAAAEPKHDRSARPVRVVPLLAMFAWSIGLVLFLVFFVQVKNVLLGFLAACAIAALLRPIVRALPGPRGRRATLVGIAFILTTLCIVMLTVRLIAQPIRQQLSNWPQIRQDLDGVFLNFSTQFGLQQPLSIDTILSRTAAFFGAGGSEMVSYTTNVVAEMLIALAFIFVGSLYLLTAPPGQLSEPLSRMLPRRHRQPFNHALIDLEPRLRWWLIGTFISMTVVGLLSWAGFAIIGLRFAAAVAILMAVAEIIPTIGPMAAFLVALLLALAQGMTQVVGVIALWSIIQVVESYVLLPLVMRRAVKVPPVITLFTVVLWGKVFGVGGLLLAIPIDLVIWSMADHFLLRRGGVAERPEHGPSSRSRMQTMTVQQTH
jgi:predicted PurR-regulated permease PerM